LAYHGLSINLNYDLMSELPLDCSSVKGTSLLRDYFPAGQIGPVELLAYRMSGGFDDNATLRQHVGKLDEYLQKITYTDSQGAATRPIFKVHSLMNPLGSQSKQYGAREVITRRVIRAQAIDNFLTRIPANAGKVIRFELVCSIDPFCRESIPFLDYLERQLAGMATDPNSPWYGTHFFFAGPTAQIRDLKEVSAADMRLIQVLVPIAVMAVLIVLLRRPITCAFLVVSVLFGYFVSIGFTTLLFSWIRGQSFIGLDWKVPMYLFVLLIALGEDYNIYLLSRVAEEQKRLGFYPGLHFALVRTGSIITSCGLIMAGTFASMITGTLSAVQELGVALSFGVLLDTLVIRTALVPAFLSVWRRLCRRFAVPRGNTDDFSAP
jgi:RND superfamily putative drug exporter